MESKEWRVDEDSDLGWLDHDRELITVILVGSYQLYGRYNSHWWIYNAPLAENLTYANWEWAW